MRNINLILLFILFQNCFLFNRFDKKFDNRITHSEKFSKFNSISIKIENYKNPFRINATLLAYLPLILESQNEDYSPFDDVNLDRIPIENTIKDNIHLQLRKASPKLKIQFNNTLDNNNSDILLMINIQNYFCRRTTKFYGLSLYGIFLFLSGLPIFLDECFLSVESSIKTSKSDEISKFNYSNSFDIHRGIYYNSNVEENMYLHDQMINETVQNIINDIK